MSASRPTRRRVLGAGARGSAAVLLGGAALVSCTQPRTPPQPDPLESVARHAAADVALATAIAAAHPALAEAATAVATDRRAHAEAVRGELRRVTPTPSPSSTPTVPADLPVADDPAAARRELDGALRTAQHGAAVLVESAPGHRAGLLASIAACCASHLAVLP